MSLPNSPEFVVAEEATAAAPKGTTIDLQGVASFAGLVEVIAQELGTSSGKMLGHLPSGPAAFNQLVGEIEISKQGFTHKLVLAARPGSPLSLRFQTQYNDGRPTESEAPKTGTNITLNANSVTADFYLGATVEQILPQARALARYAEDVFAVLDRMVGLGGGVNRFPASTVSGFDIQAFEASEGSGLVRPANE